jgi:RNA polymerase sigma-70 factor (ECF subfamily)
VASDVAEDRELRAEYGDHPEAQLLARELSHIVTLELGKMSEKNRVAYVLLREEGLSAKEAAVALGTTVNAVKQRAHRAYEQIRSAVGAGGWIEPANDTLCNSRVRFA